MAGQLVAYLEDMKDKVLGYMALFSVSDKIRAKAELVQSLLKEYYYEGDIEKPTPQKAFKRAMEIFKQIKEQKEVKKGNKEIKLEVTYDTITTKDKVYLIRKYKILGDKKPKADTERLALLYLKNGKVIVESVSKHIGSSVKALSEEEREKIEKLLNERYELYLHYYDGKIIRSFIRDRILRERCDAIPFVGHGGAWFFTNNESITEHAKNLKEIVDRIRESSPNKKISMIYIPLFDSKDIKEKIKEEIAREVTSRYKKLLSAILQKVIHAKSGEQIEGALNELLKNEDSIVNMLKEYAGVIKSSIQVEIADLSNIKRKIIDTIDSKDIKVDRNKVEMILQSIGNVKSESVEIAEKEEEEGEGISLISDSKIKMLVEGE